MPSKAPYFPAINALRINLPFHKRCVCVKHLFFPKKKTRVENFAEINIDGKKYVTQEGLQSECAFPDFPPIFFHVFSCGDIDSSSSQPQSHHLGSKPPPDFLFSAGIDHSFRISNAAQVFFCCTKFPPETKMPAPFPATKNRNQTPTCFLCFPTDLKLWRKNQNSGGILCFLSLLVRRRKATVRNRPKATF